MGLGCEGGARGSAPLHIVDGYVRWSGHGFDVLHEGHTLVYAAIEVVCKGLRRGCRRRVCTSGHEWARRPEAARCGNSPSQTAIRFAGIGKANFYTGTFVLWINMGGSTWSNSNGAHFIRVRQA
jgi:hypothetical protein